jgi:ATP-dependent Clp protease adaptor protein ClpS
MSRRAALLRSSTMPAEAEPEVLPDDPETDELGETESEEAIGTDRPWIVIVWNDPVNLMSYVVYVFQKLFGYSKEKATRLMMQVHKEGRAVVSDGTREKCEADVSRLHAHGLWATMEHPA